MKRKQLLHKSMAVLTALLLQVVARVQPRSRMTVRRAQMPKARMLITEQMGRIRLHLNRRRTWCSH